MSGNPGIRKSRNAGPDYNPKLPGQFNVYGGYKQNKAAATLNKSEGPGLMVSAFQSREYGLGLPQLTEVHLMQINERRRGKDYREKDAAIEISGHSRKEELTESPFVLFFEYGKSKNS